jgi:hypothetical protein
MDWMSELIAREKHLKQEITELKNSAGKPKIGLARRAHFYKQMRLQIDDIQSLLDDYLCGRNETECTIMSYKARLGLPIFSHLHSIYSASKSK